MLETPDFRWNTKEEQPGPRYLDGCPLINLKVDVVKSPKRRNSVLKLKREATQHTDLKEKYFPNVCITKCVLTNLWVDEMTALSPAAWDPATRLEPTAAGQSLATRYV